MMVFAHVQGEHLPAVRHQHEARKLLQLGRLGLTAQFDRRLLKFRVPERDKVKLPERDKVERNVGCLGQDAKPLIHVRKVIAL